MMAWLAGQRHQQLTDERLGELITELENASLDDDQRANVREMRRMHDQAIRLPKTFVETFAQARSEALVAWQQARADSDFEAFKPSLEHLLALTREKIALLGVKTTPYDVLLDEYEVGMTVEDYDPLFAGLKQRLVPLLQAITKSQSTSPDPVLPETLRFPVEAQKAFCEAVSANMGFDFEAGRMDASTHGLIQRSEGVHVAELGPRHRQHLRGRVELHRARAQRDHRGRQGQVARGQAVDVAQQLVLGVVRVEDLVGHERARAREGGVHVRGGRGGMRRHRLTASAEDREEDR